MILEEKVNYNNFPNYRDHENINLKISHLENFLSIEQNEVIIWRKNYDFDILTIVDYFHDKINCLFVIMFHFNEEKLKEKMYFCKPITYRHNFFELLAYNNRFARFHTSHIVRNFEDFIQEIPSKYTGDISDIVCQTEQKFPIICSRPTPSCIEIGEFIFNLAEKIIYNKNIHYNIFDDTNMYTKNNITGSVIYAEPGVNCVQHLLNGILKEYSLNTEINPKPKLLSNATCIITPYHKVDYWVSTIKNIQHLELDVFKIKSKQDWLRAKYQDLIKATFVVINKELLEDKGPIYNQLMKWGSTNNYFYSEADTENAFNIYLQEFLCYKNITHATKPLPQAIHWNRIVFDEYNTHKYFKLGWVYKNLSSNKRWFLSSCILLTNNAINTSILEKYFSSDCGLDFLFLFKNDLQKVIHKITNTKTANTTYISTPRNIDENIHGYPINRFQESFYRNTVSIYKPRTNISSYVSIINTSSELKEALIRDGIATSGFLSTININDNFCFLCQDSKEDIIWFSCGHIMCEECLQSWVNRLITDGVIRNIKQSSCAFCKQRDVNMYTLNNHSIQLHSKPKIAMDLIQRCLGKTIVVCLDSRIAVQLKNFKICSIPSFVLEGSVYKKNVLFKNWVDCEEGVLYISNLDDICGLDDYSLDNVIFYDGMINIYNEYFKNMFDAKHYILQQN